MQRIEIDCTTGEVEVVTLTAEERQEREAEIAAAQATREAELAAPDPQEVIRTAIANATTLQGIKDALLGKTTNVEVGGKPK